MDNLPQLILHIGAGKAGSTAIQFALKRNMDLLLGQKAGYVGLMLEQVPGATAHDWCVEGEPQRFFNQPPADRRRVDDQVHSVIWRELRRLGALGVDRVIWSNEAFLSQSARIIEIVRRLAADGVDLRIICYLRRHDEWARSAYVQFGLKGKHYHGPIQSFRDWITKNPVKFAPDVETWRRAFPGWVELYNYDVIKDAVAHFATISAIEGLPSLRANESPSEAILAAHVVNNDQFEDPVMPEATARLLSQMRINAQRESRVPALDVLMPTSEDLVGVQGMCDLDLNHLNILLAAQGQPPLVFDAPADRRRGPTTWELDRLMLQMILSLQRQVGDLRAEIAALKGESRG